MRKRVINIAGLRLLLSLESLQVAPLHWHLRTWISRQFSFTDDSGALHLTCLPNSFSMVYVKHPFCFWKVMNLEWAEGVADIESLSLPGR